MPKKKNSNRAGPQKQSLTSVLSLLAAKKDDTAETVAVGVCVGRSDFEIEKRDPVGANLESKGTLHVHEK
jgi:hypothetical protein